MKTLSAYIAGALRRPLPPAVLEKTRHHLLDTLAAMVSGSRLPTTKASFVPPEVLANEIARTSGGTKEAFVVGSREPDTIAASVSSRWCLVFSSTAGGSGRRSAPAM